MRELQRELLPGGKRLLALDVFVVVWAVAWLAVGLSVAREVSGLSDLSETVTRVGAAVTASGEAIAELEPLPVVGDRLSEPAGRISEAGRSAVTSGRSSADSVDNLAVLLGGAIAVIPSLPLLLLYLPARVGRWRDVRALRTAATSGIGDPAFERFLAHRALERLSYSELTRLGIKPWEALETFEIHKLARIELNRVGLERGAARPRRPRPSRA